MTNHSADVKPRIAKLRNVARLMEAMERVEHRAEMLPGLVCFYGYSGLGKSTAASFAANTFRATYIECRSYWTKKAFLEALLKELGEPQPRGTIAALADRACEVLDRRARPLIIDEMDHVVERNYVELLRDLFETAQVPIILIGEELLPTKLARWERFHGRVLDWVIAASANLADARELAGIYCRDVTVADDLLERILQISGGSARRVAVNLDAVREVANTSGKKDFDLATWGDRDFFTGEHPLRRGAA